MSQVMQRQGERKALERGGGRKRDQDCCQVGVWSRGMGKVRGRRQLGGAQWMAVLLSVIIANHRGWDLSFCWEGTHFCWCSYSSWPQLTMEWPFIHPSGSGMGEFHKVELTLLLPWSVKNVFYPVGFLSFLSDLLHTSSGAFLWSSFPSLAF